MSVFDLAFSPFAIQQRPSVYVISDSEMKAYKTKQAAAEILELQRLIDYHKTQALNLEEQVTKIEQDYPALAPTAESATDT